MTEPFPIHFVIGTGRCGSSLLHEIVCRHQDVQFLSNLDDRLPVRLTSPRWSSVLHRVLPPAASRKGRPRFAPSEGYRAAEREVSSIMSLASRDLLASDATPWLADRVDAFFRSRFDAARGGMFVHKWTGWPRAGLMHAVFPEARFVNVVRDGRAVANSWLQMSWWHGYQGPEHWQWGPLTPEEREIWDRCGRSFPVLASLLWAKLVDAADQARAQLPADAWLDVKYEDFVAKPYDTLELILAFLELPQDPTVSAGLARYSFDASRREAFLTDLGPVDVEQMTAAVSAPLERHGYL